MEAIGGAAKPNLLHIDEIVLRLIRSFARPVLSMKAPLSAPSLGFHLWPQQRCGIVSLCRHLSAIKA